jgi:aminoglycoside phosphotransferase (APT) family kinase protein
VSKSGFLVLLLSSRWPYLRSSGVDNRSRATLAPGRWIEGDHPRPNNLADPYTPASDLADIIHAFHLIDLPHPPAAYRGRCRRSTHSVRQCIDQVADEFDPHALTGAWETSLAAPGWDRPPLWVHSDLLPSNLLIRDGRLVAVIEFCNAGVGDPAHDLMVAWNVLPPDARETFREAVGLDDATWLRGRGWSWRKR